jgi:enoyl-CoA hydratase/carnithine racemase
MSLVLKQTDDEGIVTLTLNAPESRNAISDLPMIEALIEALQNADADPKTRVIILTGSGTAFSSGGNIKRMAPGEGDLADTLPARTRQNYRRGIQRIPLAMEALEVPVIAAVNGPAVGAGCDLCLMCDIRLAGESASFAESFVKLGLIPGDGGAWLLPRVVGFSKACELALTGERVDATEALRIGLVSKVVADQALMAEARAIALRIAANPAQAVRMTRRLLRQTGQLRLEQALELSAAFQALAHATDDHREALAAALERRKPEFGGQ